MEVPALTWAIVAAGPVVVMGVALYNSVQTDLQELRDNWVKYRCYPIYMPFAEQIQPDVSSAENFSYCMNMFGQAVMDAALDPIYSLFAVILDIVKDLQGSTGVVRTILVKISSVIMSVVQGVFGKLLNTMGVLLQQLAKLRDITERVTGSTWYFGMIATSMVDFLMSVLNFTMSLVKGLVIAAFALSLILALFYPPILAFSITLGAAIGISFNSCFDPETPIELHDGTFVPIRNLIPGDRLKYGDHVEGVFLFRKDPGVQMFDVDGIAVSGYHKLYHNGKVIHVKDYELATPIETNIERLVCLITDTHRIPIKGFSSKPTIFADYEEDMDREVLDILEKKVFGRVVNQTSYRGLFPDLLVKTKDGAYKKLTQLKLGDQLEDGPVEGVLYLDGTILPWVERGGFMVSADQPIYVNETVLLAKEIPTLRPAKGCESAIQLVIGNKTGRFHVYTKFGERIQVCDYFETHDPTMQLEMEQIVLDHLGKNTSK
jgi:hypothetical protein